jgi:hypothetical protein
MNLLCSTFPYLDDCGNSSTGFTAVNEHRETLSRKRNSKDLSMGKLDSLTFKFIRFTTNMCGNNFSIKLLMIICRDIYIYIITLFKIVIICLKYYFNSLVSVF